MSLTFRRPNAAVTIWYVSVLERQVLFASAIDPVDAVVQARVRAPFCSAELEHLRAEVGAGDRCSLPFAARS